MDKSDTNYNVSAPENCGLVNAAQECWSKPLQMTGGGHRNAESAVELALITHDAGAFECNSESTTPQDLNANPSPKLQASPEQERQSRLSACWKEIRNNSFDPDKTNLSQIRRDFEREIESASGQKEAALRLEYGIVLYASGYKDQGVTMIQTIENVDKSIFQENLEVNGALSQMRRNAPINVSEFVNDAFIAAAAKSLNLGGWLNPNAAETELAVVQLALSVSYNREASERLVERLSRTLSTNDKKLLSDCFADATVMVGKIDHLRTKISTQELVGQAEKQLNLGGWLNPNTSERTGALQDLAIAYATDPESTKTLVRQHAAELSASDYLLFNRSMNLAEILVNDIRYFRQKQGSDKDYLLPR